MLTQLGFIFLSFSDYSDGKKNHKPKTDLHETTGGPQPPETAKADPRVRNAFESRT